MLGTGTTRPGCLRGCCGRVGARPLLQHCGRESVDESARWVSGFWPWLDAARLVPPRQACVVVVDSRRGVFQWDASGLRTRP